MCDGKNHPLIDIYESLEYYGASEVVRWCPDCGAIVIDVDVDNRIRHGPGRVMKMKFPKFMYDFIELKKLHAEARAGAKYPKDGNKY
ncbi:hypothetical protein LCGC14_2474980 [marine sediment metagenome]|uniref:Uncharacterized protein n=1 Tax=marine sediment metagenome TaxID=412755 RepID=A0A0F9DLA9_9ZZZZ